MKKEECEKFVKERTDGVYITKHLKGEGGCGKWFPHLMLFENIECPWCGKNIDVYGQNGTKSKKVIDFNERP